MRRDADGRITRLTDLLGLTAGGLVLGALALLLVDAAFALLGGGRFGEVSGWPAAILPVWTFVEEFRAWRGIRSRLMLTLTGAALALVLGLGAAGLASGLLGGAASGRAGGSGGVALTFVPGVIGTAVGVGVYAVLWFVGIRRLAGKEG